MKIKSIGRIISSTLIVGLLLSGCTKDNNPDDTATSEPTQQETTEQSINKFFTDYYTTWINNPDSVEDSIKVDEAFMEVFGPENYEGLYDTANDPEKLFKKLDDKQIKELADKLEEINQISKFYDFRKTSDKDRAYVNLTAITYSQMLQGASGKKVNVTVSSDDNFAIKDNSITIQSSDVIFELDGSRLPNSNEDSGIERTKLNRVDGKWKIDASDMMKQVNKKLKENKK